MIPKFKEVKWLLLCDKKPISKILKLKPSFSCKTVLTENNIFELLFNVSIKFSFLANVHFMAFL